MILAGPPVATTPNHYHHHIVDGIFRKIASDLAYGLTISAFSTDGERVYIVAPNLVSAAKWETTYPERHMSINGHLVPLHIAVTGDVEGGVA